MFQEWEYEYEQRQLKEEIKNDNNAKSSDIEHSNVNNGADKEPKNSESSATEIDSNSQVSKAEKKKKKEKRNKKEKAERKKEKKARHRETTRRSYTQTTLSHVIEPGKDSRVHSNTPPEQPTPVTIAEKNPSPSKVATLLRLVTCLAAFQT